MSSTGQVAVGPLAEKALAFISTMSVLVSDHDAPDTAEYWAPLQSFVHVDAFRRMVPRETFADDVAEWDQDMDWDTYLASFRRWRSSKPRYHNEVTRIAEFADLVYLEIDEHHGDHVFPSISTYQFNTDGKIVGVRVAAATDRVHDLRSS